MNYPIGNAVLITSKQNPHKFVVVHRKENPLLVCFPGGKQEIGEDSLMSIKRETKEETGIEIEINQLVPIHTGVCEGQKEFWITTYWVEIDESTPLNSPEPEMQPFWITRDDFNERNSFPIYNAKVFKAYDQLNLVTLLELG